MSVAPSALRQIYTSRSQREESFYAPSFLVEVGPSEDVLSPVFDVSRVTYKDNVNQIDSIDFTVNDWNWEPSRPRYDGNDLTSRPAVQPAAWVRLWMGYPEPTGLFPMLTGRITTITPTLSGGGAATVSVRALSSLEALRAVAHSVKWPRSGPAKTISEIAQLIGAANPQNRFEVIVAPGSGAREPRERSVTQSNETDIAFLIKQARSRGYIVLFREVLSNPGGSVVRRAGEPMPQSMKKIWFGPSNMLLRNERQQLGDEVKPFDLRWGKSLIEFRPTVNVSTNLWKEVRFSFWNRTTKATEKIRYVLGNDGKKNDGVLWDDEHGLNQDLAPMLDMAALGEHDVTDHPVHTSGEAKNLARNLLRDNFLDLVKAEGTTVGVPELRAGCRVKVTGNGSPLEGHYFVTGTTHTIDDNGYRTSFTARREQTRDDG